MFHLYENIMPNKEGSNEELMRYASDLSIELHPFRQILSKPYSSDEWLVRSLKFYQEVFYIKDKVVLELKMLTSLRVEWAALELETRNTVPRVLCFLYIDTHTNTMTPGWNTKQTRKIGQTLNYWKFY